MTKPLDEAQLKADEKLCHEATDGPWIVTQSSIPGYAEVHLPDGAFTTWNCDNIEFIARARSALPEYVIEVRRLREEIERLKEDKESLFLEVGEPQESGTLMINHPTQLSGKKETMTRILLCVFGLHNYVGTKYTSKTCLECGIVKLFVNNGGWNEKWIDIRKIMEAEERTGVKVTNLYGSNALEYFKMFGAKK